MSKPVEMSNNFDYLIIIAGLHCFIFAVDNLLKYYFQKRCCVHIQLFIFRWFTSVFNRGIQRLGTWRSKYQKTWYTFGMWISLFCLPLALYFILQSTFALLVNILWNDTKLSKLEPFLKPAIPGLNVPISDMGYYMVSLLLSSVFHELGHALAAVREGLRITGFGFFVVFLFPAAFVRIEGLENLSTIKQLRICCAGVWHNIVLAIAAALLLLFLPWLCYPFYDYGNGIQVMALHKNSPLLDEGGLKVGDVITSINKCSVLNEVTWIRCIQQLIKTPIPGYCLTPEFVHKNDESTRVKQLHNVIECCSNVTLSRICFEYLEEVDNPLELPQYSCLRVRDVLQHSDGTCHSSSDCYSLHCFRPSLTNGTKLIEIERKQSNEVLFLGYPLEVLYGVHISEFVETRYFSASIPLIMAKFFNFVIKFSGALAALNLVPCFHFDGQYIARILVHISLSKSIRLKSVRIAIALSITILGTIILVSYTILMLISVLIK